MSPVLYDLLDGVNALIEERCREAHAEIAASVQRARERINRSVGQHMRRAREERSKP